MSKPVYIILDEDYSIESSVIETEEEAIAYLNKLTHENRGTFYLAKTIRQYSSYVTTTVEEIEG